MQGEAESSEAGDTQAKAPAPSQVEVSIAKPVAEPRLLKPQREGVVRVACNLDQMLPADHVARDLWALIEKLDLSEFEVNIRSRESHPGRPAIDPRILVGLWVYATTEGVYEARELDRLCRLHLAYLWICGGVAVDYHVLSDFRVKHGPALDRLMSQVLEWLKKDGGVKLERTAQDGMRVRASAGASSFHREATLQKNLQEARQKIQQIQERPEPTNSGSQAAQERAARQREERVGQALEELPKVREIKPEEKKAQARVSTTDPQARVMKMADGGFRPAYNVEFGVDTATRAIVEAGVSNQGSDQGRMQPMLEQIQVRHGKLPREHLVDGGFAKKENIEHAAARGVMLYAPVQKPKKDDVNRYAPKPEDSPAVTAWRQRMGTPEVKEIYKLRGATVETVNADAREHRGLDRFVVRGLKKVRCVVLWFAITYNLLRLLALGALP